MYRGTALTQLEICTFRGLQNLPLFIAIRHGFFASRGFDINVRYTSGSAAQIGALVRDEYELVQTAPDNVIWANSTPGQFDLDAPPNIVMLLGGSVGPLSVYAQPRFTTLADLQGAVLGVDNPDSGFALVLRDMLAHSHMALNQDYALTVSGGTSARLDALKEGAVAATILYAPYDAMAEVAGLRRLAISTEYYSAYASLATAARREWVEGHGSEVIRYISAILQALHWIYDPANAVSIQSVLRDEVTLGLDADIAAQAYAAFVAPGTGFGATARLDEAGLREVTALRGRYGTLAASLDVVSDYCDLRWYDEACTAYR